MKSKFESIPTWVGFFFPVIGIIKGLIWVFQNVGTIISWLGDVFGAVFRLDEIQV